MSEDSVARFIQIASDNLSALKQNLVELDYRFAQTEPIQYTNDADCGELAKLEESVGPLPLLFRSWYRTFRRIDFSQEYEQLKTPNPSPVAGLGQNCVLVFLDIPSAHAMRAKLTEENALPKKDSLYFFPSGEFASNCEPKGIWLPDASIDPPLYNDGNGAITLSTELAHAFAADGFPFWPPLLKRGLRHHGFPNTPRLDEIHHHLCRGLTELSPL